MSFLVLQGLTKHYAAARATDAIDLVVARGSRTSIVGPSGSGKSTLMRLIAGFEAPDAGTIRLDGTVLAEGGISMPAHRRGIGIVVQDGALFPHLSVAENVAFGLPPRDAGRAARVRDLMAMVDLDISLLDRRPDQISGGQQQRVALARALAPNPRLLLLDEPFSALDTALRISTRKAVIALLAATGVTALLVTHDQAEALSFADQVAVMHKGRLAQVGPPHRLYRQPVDRMVAEFLGEAIILSAVIEGRAATSILGPLAVAEGHPSGRAEVMLRPEQVRVHVLSAEAGVHGAGVFGRVMEMEFAGASCAMVVEVPGGAPAAPARRIALQRSSMDALPVGTQVQISVAGEAHVFG
ncbi:ABC transporter ATP-binding protein [Azorhizobium doebereinerae]|uniref:ABC transporter ATP-binding protein n=1 Tax=Azorhizobium doebereinerae TaxID=281091 RepID=UPI000429B7FC|nr:ABC transporter ATP-binding protein [Azorhizobium doebereinerae]